MNYALVLLTYKKIVINCNKLKKRIVFSCGAPPLQSPSQQVFAVAPSGFGLERRWLSWFWWFWWWLWKPCNLCITHIEDSFGRLNQRISANHPLSLVLAMSDDDDTMTSFAKKYQQTPSLSLVLAMSAQWTCQTCYPAAQTTTATQMPRWNYILYEYVKKIDW